MESKRTGRWHRRVVIAAVLILAAPLTTVSPQAAEAQLAVQDVGGRLISTGGPVAVEVEPVPNSLFTSTLFLLEPQEIELATNRDVGRVIDIGTFDDGVELVFGIRVNGNEFRTGPGGRNPDGIVHAAVTELADGRIRVGFEDILGGGDRDYNDNLFVFVGDIETAPPGPFADGTQFEISVDEVLDEGASVAVSGVVRIGGEADHAAIDSVVVTVDGGGAVAADTSNPLPVAGPAELTWSAAVNVASTAELCVTATGRAGEDRAEVQSCVAVDGPSPTLPRECPSDSSSDAEQVSGQADDAGVDTLVTGSKPLGTPIRIELGDHKLVANDPDRSVSPMVRVSDLEGAYAVRLHSADEAHPAQAEQPNEQWELLGYDGSGQLVFQTVAADDLVDASAAGATEVGVYDFTGVVAVQARHARPVGRNPNSVTSVAATLVPAAESIKLRHEFFGPWPIYTAPVPLRFRSRSLPGGELRGRYEVELYSIDRHHLGPDFDQDAEQWRLVGLDSQGRTRFVTTPADDLDRRATANRTAVGIYDLTGVVALRAEHRFPSGPLDNSVNAAGVAFTPVQAEPDSVEFTNVSVAPGEAITHPIELAADLALANGTTIASWRSVAYETFSCVERALEMAGGDGSPAGRFGRFDPNGLSNGTWVSRLEVTDSEGNVSHHDTVVVVEGGLKQGRVGLSTVDASISLGGGIPLAVLRSYDTLETREFGDFGYGWTLDSANYEVSPLTPNGEGGSSVHLVWPDGTVETFNLETTPISGDAGQSTVGYATQPGTTSTLHPVASDETAFLTAAGELLTSDTDRSPYDPTRFELVTRQGTRFVVDRDAGLVRSVDANGTSIAYDALAITSRLGPLIEIERDEQGRITSVVEPSGGRAVYNYDQAGDLISTTDPNGNTTAYTYDRQHRLLSVDDPSPGVALSLRYDSAGRLQAIESADGRTVDAEEDTEARVSTITSADGKRVTKTSFDERGNAVQIDQVFDGQSHVSTYEYNEADLLTGRTDPLGNAWRIDYDDNLNAVGTLDAEGNRWQYAYNDRGLLTTVADPTGAASTFTYDANNNVISSTDAEGATTSHTYDATGNRLTTTDPLGRTTTRTYNDSGRALSVTDARGNTTSYAYNADGQVVSVEAADGGATTYIYDDAGNMVSVTDPLGRTTIYSYDASNRVVSETDPGGFVTTYSYDGVGQMTASADPTGAETTYDYEFGRLAKRTAADGAKILYGYNSAGLLASITDPLGRVTRFGYDDAGRRVSTETPAADGSPAIQRFELNGNGQPVASTNAVGETTRFRYDPLNRVTTRIDPLGHEWVTSYDRVGNRVAATDPLGASRTWTYDPARQPVAAVDELGAETGSSYDEVGNLVATTDQLGRTTSFTYDALNRGVSTRHPSGDISSATYDLAGQVTGVAASTGATTTYAYDARGLLTSSTDAFGATSVSAYDEAGRAISQTDARGNKTVISYDAVGRVITEQDPLGGIVTFAYDEAGQRIAVTDPNGATRTVTYNDAGLMATETDALGRTSTFAYDDAGRQTSNVDRRGIEVTTAYDAAGRMIGQVTSGEQRTYVYDALGRVLSTEDATGATTFDYDSAGRLTSVDSPAGAISYTWDAAGQRSTMTQPEGTVSYGWDANGFPRSIKDWGGRTTEFTYDAEGRPLTTNRSNGIATTYSYDNAARLTGVTHRRGDEVIADHAYTLDADGYRTAEAGPDGTDAYTLDPLNRLTNATYRDGSSETFAYGAAGHRTSHTRRDGTTITFTVDAAGQLVEDSSGVTYSYDLAGNLVATSAGDQYTWNDWGDLTAATVGDISQTYRVDANGVRTQVDGVDQLWDRAELPVLVGAGSETFTHSPEGILAAGNSWLLADGLGSVRSVVDADGSLLETASYTAFGEPIDASSADSFGFAGEQSDPTGLSHLRARTYNPALGRFISADGVQPGGPGTGGWNLYSYAANNPVSMVDPSGNFVTSTLVGEAQGAVRAQAVGNAMLAFVSRLAAQITSVAVPAAVVGGGVLLAGDTATRPAVETIDDPLLAQQIRDQFEEIITDNFGNDRPRPGPIAIPRPAPIPLPDNDTTPGDEDDNNDDDNVISLHHYTHRADLASIVGSGLVHGTRGRGPARDYRGAFLTDLPAGESNRLPWQELAKALFNAPNEDGCRDAWVTVKVFEDEVIWLWPVHDSLHGQQWSQYVVLTEYLPGVVNSGRLNWECSL